MRFRQAIVSTGVLISLAVLTACLPTKNHVDIDVKGFPNTSGVVALCSWETSLTRRGTRLQAAVPITCEGSGEVRLCSETGATAIRLIGYVTPGAEQEFSFALEGGGCVPVFKDC